MSSVQLFPAPDNPSATEAVSPTLPVRDAVQDVPVEVAPGTGGSATTSTAECSSPRFGHWVLRAGFQACQRSEVVTPHNERVQPINRREVVRQPAA
jgi:hypothetical protein